MGRCELGAPSRPKPPYFQGRKAPSMLRSPFFQQGFVVAATVLVPLVALAQQAPRPTETAAPSPAAPPSVAPGATTGAPLSTPPATAPSATPSTAPPPSTAAPIDRGSLLPPAAPTAAP